MNYVHIRSKNIFSSNLPRVLNDGRHHQSSCYKRTELELTSKERAKVALKRIVSNIFNLFGGFSLFAILGRKSVTIVTYHRIISDEYAGARSYISVNLDEFRRQVGFYRRHYRVISLAEAVDKLINNQVDGRYLVITFDDGYQDNYALGMEVFKDEGVRPTIFVTTGCIDRQEPLWPDKVRKLLYNAHVTGTFVLPGINMQLKPDFSNRVPAVKAVIRHLKTMSINERDEYIAALRQSLGQPADQERLMLNWEEIKQLIAGGVDIGGHTVNHPVLSQIDSQASFAEITGCKTRIEENISMPITSFAYPNGTTSDFTDEHVDQLKEAGFKTAVTTIRGVNRPGADLFRLRRTGIYLTDSLNDIKLKLALERMIG